MAPTADAAPTVMRPDNPPILEPKQAPAVAESYHQQRVTIKRVEDEEILTYRHVHGSQPPPSPLPRDQQSPTPTSPVADEAANPFLETSWPPQTPQCSQARQDSSNTFKRELRLLSSTPKR